MTVSLHIVPLSHSIEMRGSPDRNSAYSLSGHVSISIHPSHSTFFDSSRRTTRLLLQSLELTFEGQSELFTPHTGYAPMRLCSTTRQLAPAGAPIELSNEGHEDTDEPSTWNVIFNVPVPGWLPATSSFGDDQHGQAGISYNLYATAKLSTVEDEATPRSWFSFASLCSAFSSRTQMIYALPCPITLTRFLPTPPSPEGSPKLGSMSSVFGPTLYQTTSRASETRRHEGGVPVDVLDKIKVFARVPEHVAIGTDERVPLALRLSAEGLTDEESARLQVTGFSVDIEQVERYRPVCPTAYTTAFPVPSSAQQPSRVPLRTQHPLRAVYELGVGLHGYLHSDIIQQRSFSLLSSQCPGEFRFAGDTHVFVRTPEESTAAARDPELARSYTVDAPLPLMPPSGDDVVDEKIRAHEASRLGWSSRHVIRPTADSPHLAVRHRMHVSLLCLWETPGAAEPAQERVEFSVPLSFVHVQQAQLPTATPPTESAAKPHYPSGSLPAYSQLFYSNGERRLEYGLPAYEPVGA